MAESIVQLPAPTVKMHTWNRTIGVNSVEDEVVLMGNPYVGSYTVVSTLTSAATAASHLMQLMAGASLNVYVTRIRIFQVGAATTGAFPRFHIIRLTTAGTGGSAVTSSPLDTSDAASGATGMTLSTVKGTEGTTLYTGSARAVQTIGASGAGTDPLLVDWDFDRRKSKAIRIAAGTANGIVIKASDGTAAMTVDIVIEFYEANF